jgi:hypothetical protein
VVGGQDAERAVPHRCANQRGVAPIARPGFDAGAGRRRVLDPMDLAGHAQPSGLALAMRRPRIGGRLQAVMHVDRDEPGACWRAGRGGVHQHCGIESAAPADHEDRRMRQGPRSRAGLAERPRERRDDGISVLRRSP